MSHYFQVLDEQLLSIDCAGARRSVSLPELLAALCADESVSLAAVQAHQQHAIHAFLVQLAAISLTRAGLSALSSSADEWRDLLVRAAAQDGAGAEAFALVVTDLSKPAFMQPPVPEKTLSVLKSSHSQPTEELDVLITAKNHDVKINRLDHAQPEHWIYGLITLQTMQGFLGAGNYGVSRMNGGFSSRPCVAFADDVSMNRRFRRDLTALLGARQDLLARGFARKAQLGLLWCVPWDGTKSLPFEQLDPHYIEVCRRVRLSQNANGECIAHRGSSKVARVDASEVLGNTGDGWTPVQIKDGKALTMPEAGFTYDRVRALMLGDEWTPGAAGRAAADGQDHFWVGQVLVRGQGKTGGYHERWIPVPAKARSIVAKPNERARLNQRAVEWVATSGIVRLKVLKPAILTLLQGGPAQLKFDDNRADGLLSGFDSAVDQVFFPVLFQFASAPIEDATKEFELRLLALAEKQFEAAVDGLPIPGARKYRAIALGARVLNGAARKHLKYAFSQFETDQEGASHE